MRFATTWMMTLLLAVVGTAYADSAGRLLTRIPSEFQGRWLTNPEQCKQGYEGWLYVSDLKIEEGAGVGYVVSVRRPTALEIEVDMSWRPSGRHEGGWRKTGHFVLSQGGHTLTESRDGSSVTRTRCEP